MNQQTTEIDLRQQRRQELADTSFSANQQGGALMQPRNGRELMDMANMMSQSGQMVRDFYRGNAGDCAALIMICQPYGFNPFMVSWKTYKASKSADAPISFEGQLVNAMVNQSAPVKGRLKYVYEGDGPELTCTVIGIDRETGEEITYTSPKVKEISIKNSPLWKSDPQQQLGYFSARSWARRHFPELLLGVYTRDEIESAPTIRDVTPTKPDGPNLAQRLQGEQTKPETVEAEIIPDMDQTDPKAEEPKPIEPDQIEFDDDAVDPFADEYTEGVKANQAAMREEHCPHKAGTVEWNNWLGGWRFFEGQKGGEE
jgi:ribosome modulation factor